MAEFNQAAPLGFVDAVKRVINKYAEFKGTRIARRIPVVDARMPPHLVASASSPQSPDSSFLPDDLRTLRSAVLVPALAVSWRRLHDTGRAGGWRFINFIPQAPSSSTVFCAAPSEPQPNRFPRESPRQPIRKRTRP